jgi:mono/diheme cytochrome c family protein
MQRRTNMNRLILVVIALGFVGIVSLWMSNTPAVATAYAPDVCERWTEGAKPEFIGSKKCKKCHIKSHKSWAKTAHGKAFETLLPGKKADIKKKHGLDPAKDYTKDAKCVQCHTVGFGQKGGYAILDPSKFKDAAAHKKAAKKMKDLEGVGCESCHGAGKDYTEFFNDLMKANRGDEKKTYKQAEVIALGLVVPTEKTCITCHNEKSPTVAKDEKFDFKEMQKKGVHDHEDLKLQEK